VSKATKGAAEHWSDEATSLDAGSLVRDGDLTVDALEFLQACLEARLNLAISGPFGAGKRALLHRLVSYMADDGQIMAIQNPDEPSLEASGITSLRAHPDREDGGPSISRHYLLALVPKMHPTGLILDRVEGAEAASLLQLLLAMDGVVFSIVAESPRDALLTLERLACEHGEGTHPGIAKRILSTGLDLIIQLGSSPEGCCEVLGITEVAEAEGDRHVLGDIFACQREGLIGHEQGRSECRLQPTGVRPSFLSRIEALGICIPEHLFA
jgi:pilus assembly protein CpaF